MTGLTPSELALVGATFLASAVEMVEAYADRARNGPDQGVALDDTSVRLPHWPSLPR